MEGLNFRALRADEIDVRVATINENGCSLLLYKDARCDMNILDETVGAYNWKRSHSRDNANCTVSIWDSDKEQWIDKEDTGTESNTEAQKGLASDSFKRACFNWGIGRELYTAPFIWVKAGLYNASTKNGKPTTYDKFSVDSIIIEDKKIVGLSIRNNNTKQVVYTFGTVKAVRNKAPEIVTQISSPEQKTPPTLESVGNELKKLCVRYGYDLTDIIKECKLTKASVLNDYINAVAHVKSRAEAEGKV